MQARILQVLRSVVQTPAGACRFALHCAGLQWISDFAIRELLEDGRQCNYDIIVSCLEIFDE
eukprot:scaffold131071_cov45-Prasinocladus_malaysianus.AAC.1